MTDIAQYDMARARLTDETLSKCEPAMAHYRQAMAELIADYARKEKIIKTDMLDAIKAVQDEANIKLAALIAGERQ